MAQRSLPFALAGLAAVAFAQIALAADLPRKAPAPPPPPATPWTGCYVGVNVGGIGGGRNTADLSIGGGYLDPSNGFSNPANSGPLNHSYSFSDWGFTGGGQAGCNYQVSAWVFGIEGDFNGSSLRESVNLAYASTPTTTPPQVTSPHTEAVSKDLDWYATLRGRVGYAWSNVMLYATGGLAVAEIKSATNVAFANDVNILNTANFIGSTSVTRAGWTVGGGFEWMLNPHWTVKAEYLYLDLGRFNYVSPCDFVTGNQPGCAIGGLWNTSIRARENVARLGVNYKF